MIESLSTQSGYTTLRYNQRPHKSNLKEGEFVLAPSSQGTVTMAADMAASFWSSWSHCILP